RPCPTGSNRAVPASLLHHRPRCCCRPATGSEVRFVRACFISPECQKAQSQGGSHGPWSGSCALKRVRVLDLTWTSGKHSLQQVATTSGWWRFPGSGGQGWSCSHAELEAIDNRKEPYVDEL